MLAASPRIFQIQYLLIFIFLKRGELKCVWYPMEPSRVSVVAFRIFLKVAV